MDIEYDTFYKALRSALNYLYEPNQLRRSPLSAMLGVANRIDAPAALQRLLIDAIEKLKPASDDPAYASAWQMHDLLYLRYVRGYARDEVAGKLNMSERQLSREQRAAIDALAITLWQSDQWQSGPRQGVPDAKPQTSADAAEEANEPEEIGETDEASWVENLPVDTPAAWSITLQAVLDLLRPLLEQNRVHVRYEPDASFTDMFIPPNTVRQSLLIVLGWLIPMAHAAEITLIARMVGNNLEVVASIPAPAQMAQAARAPAALPPSMSVLQQLLEHAGGTQQVTTSAEQFAVTFSIPALARVPVLMVDDTPDTIRLFERYLQETRYALVGVTDPADIERLIAKHQPRIIILDVMMPEIDGWEILVRLRQYLDTRDAIILVCSILPLGDLARSLGANGFLQKPVLPQDLVQALSEQMARLA
jgi:CheY-like chemotaxis protein